jgi:hypothetical protein
MALTVIIILYAGIGFMSAAGTIAITRKLLPAKPEQIFFGVLLTPIAALYLAFSSYFGAGAAWRVEALAVVAFSVLGLCGIRAPLVLALAYFLHGVWDVGHELQAHAAVDVGGPGSFTPVPLAYGVFCATYDWCMAAYFTRRRNEWNAAWSSDA